MAQYKDGTYIVKDGELYKIDIKVKFPTDGITVPLSDFIKKTNADRIRAMTDEELAEMMAHWNCGYCKIHDYCFSQKGIECDEAWLDWLRKEADE